MPETFGKSHAPPAKKVKTQASSGSQAKETWLLGQQTKVVSGGEITVSSLYSGFSTAGE
jgi:hypothetical protein